MWDIEQECNHENVIMKMQETLLILKSVALEEKAPDLGLHGAIWIPVPG